MKRLLGPVLVGLGVFLLVLAVLLPTVAVPRLEKAPLDQYSVTEATGTGSYLDPTRLEFVDDDEITVTRVVRGDVEASGDDVALYDYTQTVEASQVQEPLNVVTERALFDRSTGVGTGGRGDLPSHEGAQVVKFPFDVEKRDYEYHDPTAATSLTVSFQGETEVDGLDVYEFSGSISDLQRAQQGVPGALVGAPDTASVFVEEYYSTDITLLVEPRTGSIVSTSSSPTRVWRPAAVGDQGGEETVIFDATVEATPETVSELVADAEDAKGSLNLLDRTLPIVLGLLGLVLLVVGALLLARRERGDGSGQGSRRVRTDDGIDVVRG